MSERERRDFAESSSSGGDGSAGVAPGRRSLVERTYAVQRKASGATAADPGDSLARAASSSGAPVEPGVRERFEAATGASVGDVTVHTGGESNMAADTLGARAYATGNQVHFAAGQYDPGSAAGQHLLTHELVHTVQQRGGAGVQTKSVISSPGDAGEREADRVADAIMGGGSPGPIVESTAPIAGNFLTDMFNAVWELFAGKGDKKAKPRSNKKTTGGGQTTGNQTVEQTQTPVEQTQTQTPVQTPVEQPKASGRAEKTEFGDYWVVPDNTNQTFQDAQGEQITETAFATLQGVWDKVKDGSGNIKVTDTDKAGKTHAGFKDAILAKLGLLMSKPNGRQLIGDLIGGGFDVTIRPSDAQIYGGGNAIRGGAGTLEKDDTTSGGGGTTIIQIDPACTDDDIKVYDKAGKEISDPVFIFLGHEMIHARHNQLGHNRRGLAATAPDDYSNREEEETIDTGTGITENKLREEHGLDARYGHGGEDKRG